MAADALADTVAAVEPSPTAAADADLERGDMATLRPARGLASTPLLETLGQLSRPYQVELEALVGG